MFETMGSYGDWDDYVPVVPPPEEDVEGALAADADGGFDPALAEVAALALDELESALDSDLLDDLDADGTLVEVTASVVAERRVQVRQVRLVLHWADLHGVVSCPWLSGPGRERLVQPGGDGTPEVAEFAAAELGAVFQVSVGAGGALIADALDLRHRFPQLWATVQAGLVPVWIARRTVEQARSLSADAAAEVDTRIAGIAGAVTTRRLSRIVTAAMLAADPPKAMSDAERAAAAAGVRVDPVVRHGFQTVIIEATAGDVAYFHAAIELIARALTILGDTRPVEERRASGIGILAHPTAAQQLLETAETTRHTQCAAAAARRTGNHPLADQLEATLPHHLRPTQSPDTPDDPDQTGGSDESAEWDPPEQTAEPAESPGSNASEEVVEPRRAPVRCDRKPLTFGTAVVYYHLTRETLDAILAEQEFAGAGVVRVEDIGPVIADQVQQWLQHANVTVKPVIDLAGIQPVDHYETTPTMSEAIGLINETDSWPYSNCQTRHQDNDHTQPYLPMDEGGPPVTHRQVTGPLSDGTGGPAP